MSEGGSHMSVVVQCSCDVCYYGVCTVIVWMKGKIQWERIAFIFIKRKRKIWCVRAWVTNQRVPNACTYMESTLYA